MIQYKKRTIMNKRQRLILEENKKLQEELRLIFASIDQIEKEIEMKKFRNQTLGVLMESKRIFRNIFSLSSN